MRQAIKIFLLIAGLVSGLQTSWAYSLLGPVGNAGDAWQIQQNGFNAIGIANPYRFTDDLPVAPKNIGEEYRHNTPVMYYTFDDNFTGFFGSHGTNAVIGAFTVLNNLTNVSSYSSNLTEFPLQATEVNYQARALGLLDVKSLTLAMLMEQLGVADAVRYTWVLHSRWHLGTVACPVGEFYAVTERNFDISPTPLTRLQYTPYVNNALYSYAIFEDCGATPPDPLDGASVPFPVDPLNDNPPVASGLGMGFAGFGGFYTGLTRDDVAGLRYLLRAGNVNTESPATNSLVQSNFVGQLNLLVTADISPLISAAATNDPITLTGLFTNLVVASSTFYFTNVSTPNTVTYTTNFNGEPFGTPPHVVTVTNGYTFSFVKIYNTTFANVITNSYRSNTIATLVTTTVGLPSNGGPVGGPFVTNPPTFQTVILTNVPSGDYYILPPGTCGWNLTTQSVTNVIATTNLIAAATNASGASVTQVLIAYFTNHIYIAAQVFCTNVVAAAGKYEGVENIKFVGIDHNQYDTVLGQFYVPITNNYTMSLFTPSNGVVTIQNFQRVLTAPDLLFSAADLTSLGGVQGTYNRTTPNFNTNSMLPNLAGPGTIDPGATITFNKSGLVFYNGAPNFLNGPNYAQILGSGFIYGSFDGTTNPPVVYPNGTSIADLEAQVFIQISPATLPAATSGSPYSTAFSATGGQPPYTWSLATNSLALPNGLSLSASGVISGTPTQNGVYDFILQLNDSAAHTVRRNYFITIY